MSQANAEEDLSKRQKASCFIVVGARHVECGFLVSGKWEQTISVDIADDVHGQLIWDAMSSAIVRAGAMLQPWRSLHVLPRSENLQIHVLISDTWLGTVSLPWTDTLRRAAETSNFARTQFLSSGMEIDREDQIRVDDQPYGEPRMAVSYPAACLRTLNDLAKILDGVLISILPLGYAAWGWIKKQHKDTEALAVMERNHCTIVYGASGIHGVTACDFPDLKGDENFSERHRVLNMQWRRMGLRDARLGLVDQLPVLDLGSCGFDENMSNFRLHAIPERNDGIEISPVLQLAALIGSRGHSLDVISAIKDMTPAKWAIVTLILVGALWMFGQAWNQSVQAKEILAEKESRIKKAEVAPAQEFLTKEEVLKVQAFNTAIRELNLPISGLLHALQPPRDIEVAVLSVDAAGTPDSSETSSMVKIVAEAKTYADMARYVSFVAERKPFDGAYLMRHEIDENQNIRPYRFSVEARWSE